MTLLNSLVRAYLAKSPVTEGKRALLAATRDWITPEDPEQVARTKHGFSLKVNLRNPEQARIYFYGEHDERYETALLARLIEPGMTCWDVGANIGFYTCLFARLAGAAGRVLAVEPASATRARLAENVALNGFANVTLLPCAVAASEGEASLHFEDPSLLEGTASLVGGARQGRSERVAVTTLDALAARHGAADIVKVDVEGAQLDAWRGARECFGRNAPLVMAELRDSGDAAALRELESVVRSYGYAIFEILKRRRVREVAALRPDGPRNYVLAKPGSRAAAALRSA